MIDIGDIKVDSTISVPFNTFNSDGASVTVTNLVAGDVHIHKNGGTTQRSSSAGVTVSIDFDGITGNHIIEIDLSDNTDVGFYATGNDYEVRVEGITVDTQTINAWVGSFSIENRAADVVKVSGTAQTANDNGADINTILGRIIGTLASGTHEPQTGDGYAIVNNGTYGNSAIATDISGLNDVSTADVQSSCDSAITANTDINNIDIGVDAIEAKLPSKTYLAGSSDSDGGVDSTESAIIADAVLDEVVEGTYTLRQLIRIMLSALAGKLSGAESTSISIRDAADSKNRITATVDSNGNRTAVTLDGD